MKFTQFVLSAALFAVSMQAIDAKKCKATSSTSSVAVADDTASTSSASSGSGSSGSGSSSGSSTSSSSSSTSTVSVGADGMTPNGIKAGVSGGQSIKWLANNIGAWNDWGASGGSDHTSETNAQYIPMVWGNGDDSANTGVSSATNSERLAAFEALPVGKYKYVMGFNEFDYQGTGSSGLMTASAAASLWDKLMAKHQAAGTKLVSPSCALQADEVLLRPFLDAVTVKPDCIAVHIFQDSMTGVKNVLEHYKTKYTDYNCFWITEFAYANYQDGAHNYGTVAQTDALAKEAVAYFEAEDTVKAYFISDADNGDNGDLTPDHSGTSLSSLGETYLAAISSYVSKRSLPHMQRHVRRAAAASRRAANAMRSASS